LDWRIKLDDAAKLAGGHVLQGNLDPVALFLPNEELEQRIAVILAEGRAAKGHIFNLGHGILPQTSPEQVTIAVEAVHRLSRVVRP